MTHLDWLMRTFSCSTRLRILAFILHAPPDVRGVCPSDIARHLGVSAPLVSYHLKSLLRARLVRYWKKAVLKFYRPSRLRSGSLRDRLCLIVQTQIPRDCALSPAASQTPGSDSAEQQARRTAHIVPPRTPLEPLWMALTCFSHFRRLLMIHHLLRHAHASKTELTRVMDLHPLTVAYHVDKLTRRGALLLDPKGYRLAAGQPNPVQAAVWRCLCDALSRMSRPAETP